MNLCSSPTRGFIIIIIIIYKFIIYNLYELF
jgi:hypothetical protein